MKKTRILIVLISLIWAANNISAQHNLEIKPLSLNLTADQWREDLRHFGEELPKRHKNAFHTMTREKFESAVKQLNDDIPGLKGEEIFVRFLKLIAMVGDGHTSIQESALFSSGFYPVRYEIYQDGLFVQSISAEHAGMVGGKVIKIGNIPIEETVSRIKELAWGDGHNEQSKKVEIVFLLSMPKILQGLKITDSDESVFLTVEVNGQQKTAEIKAIKDAQNYMRNAKQANAADSSNNSKPLYRKDPGNFYWFEYVKDRRILYVQFNSVLNKREESIEAFFKKVFDFADSNPVDKLILDVRMNTGGNNLLNKPIVTGLIKSKLNGRGKLFVVIGRRTFSAAQNLVNEIEKYSDAIFVGEPTGSSPNLYGDPAIITLPNSQIPFRVSTLFHQTSARDTRAFTAPEIFAELKSEDYRNNRDPVWEAILDYVPGRAFGDIVAEFASTKDLAVFLSKYKTFKSDPKNKYADTEANMNALGYQLLQAQKSVEAIEIFKLNVEAYPNSANVYDSLAEAYSLSGNKPEAIKNYERALKLNPNFSSSLDALKKLKN